MTLLSQEALAKLPPAVARAYFACWHEDIKARFIIVDLAISIYKGPGNSAENMAVASLMHAADYLADRIGYEMEPQPKGMIRIIAETEFKEQP